MSHKLKTNKVIFVLLILAICLFARFVLDKISDKILDMIFIGCTQHDVFADFENHEIVGSGRDGYVRKIADQYYFVFSGDDNSVSVYRVPRSQTTVSWYRAESEYLFKGNFRYYATGDEKLYFYKSQKEEVSIFDKKTKQVTVVSSSDSIIPSGLEWKHV